MLEFKSGGFCYLIPGIYVETTPRPPPTGKLEWWARVSRGEDNIAFVGLDTVGTFVPFVSL